MKIQLLFFPGCPNADPARAVLRQELNALQLSEAVEEVDVSSPLAPEQLRGWGSPTILVNGRDVGGEPVPAGPSCRLYANAAPPSWGVPSPELVRGGLQSASSPGWMTSLRTTLKGWAAGGNARDLGARPWAVAVWGLAVVGSLAGFFWAGARPLLWSAAFGVSGILCVANALRSRRLHCLFTGPIFLGGTALVVLRWAGYLALGWSWIGGGVLGLVGAALLLESVLGKNRIGGRCC